MDEKLKSKLGARHEDVHQAIHLLMNAGQRSGDCTSRNGTSPYCLPCMYQGPCLRSDDKGVVARAASQLLALTRKAGLLDDEAVLLVYDEIIDYMYHYDGRAPIACHEWGENLRSGKGHPAWCNICLSKKACLENAAIYKTRQLAAKKEIMMRGTRWDEKPFTKKEVRINELNREAAAYVIASKGELPADTCTNLPCDVCFLYRKCKTGPVVHSREARKFLRKTDGLHNIPPEEYEAYWTKLAVHMVNNEGEYPMSCLIDDGTHGTALCHRCWHQSFCMVGSAAEGDYKDRRVKYAKEYLLAQMAPEGATAATEEDIELALHIYSHEGKLPGSCASRPDCDVCFMGETCKTITPKQREARAQQFYNETVGLKSITPEKYEGFFQNLAEILIDCEGDYPEACYIAQGPTSYPVCKICWHESMCKAKTGGQSLEENQAIMDSAKAYLLRRAKHKKEKKESWEADHTVSVLSPLGRAKEIFESKGGIPLYCMDQIKAERLHNLGCKGCFFDGRCCMDLDPDIRVGGARRYLSESISLKQRNSETFLDELAKHIIETGGEYPLSCRVSNDARLNPLCEKCWHKPGCCVGMNVEFIEGNKKLRVVSAEKYLSKVKSDVPEKAPEDGKDMMTWKGIHGAVAGAYFAENINKQKIEEKKIMENKIVTVAKEVGSSNMTAAKSAARIKAAKVALGLVKKQFVPMLPGILQFYVKDAKYAPLFDILIANILKSATVTLKPDNEKLQMISDACLEAAYLNGLDALNIEEKLFGVLKGIDFPGFDEGGVIDAEPKPKRTRKNQEG